MGIIQKYTADELELQYNLRLARPDYETDIVPRWIRQSAALRERVNCGLDLAYGQGARERLDFFPAPVKNAPTIVYFHGGYWQRGDKSVYSFLAEPFLKSGVSVALVNYDLCPAGSISGIVSQARQSLSWIWRTLEEIGASRDRLYVMGHSAGGHITALLMATHWPTFGAGLPHDMIKGGVPISGLFELEPLRSTSINDAVRMTAEEARMQSPMLHVPATDAPQIVVCGGRETEEFHRQADEYVQAFSTSKRSFDRYVVPDADHFDELDALRDEKSIFFQKVHALVTSL